MNTIERDFCEQLSSLCDITKDRLLIAFSGGCDSLALLILSAKALGVEKVFPVYVNHNLRTSKELEKEMALNEANCRKIGLKPTICTIVRGQVEELANARKSGVEEAARVLRYQLLEQCRNTYNCAFIATAHHKQDQLETIAMGLSKGSPVSSLCGIAAKDDRRHLIRPLLNFDRKDLEDYLKEQNFTWSEDSTNKDSSYARNRLRNVVLPQAKVLWPDCEKTLFALRKAAQKQCEGKFEVEDSISVQAFRHLNPTLKTLALFDLWNKGIQANEMPMTLVMRINKATENPSGALQRICANGAEILISDRISIAKQRTENREEDKKYETFEVEFDPCLDHKIELLDGQVLLSGQLAIPHATEKSLRLETSRFKGTTKVRYAQMGDYIHLKGGKKMVLRLLQDMKVPQQLRSKIPVLVDQEGICAVFGSVGGGFDRICVKFRSSLAPNSFTLYIVN